MKFCFATLGCKVNQFETQALAQLAQQRGHVLAEKQADVCIINTCTVTSSGDHKTLRVLHKLQKENLYGNCRRAVFLQSLINSCGHDPIFHTVQGNPKYTFEGTCNSVCNIDGRWKDIVEE